MNTLEKFLKLRNHVNKVERKGLVYGASFSEFVILKTIHEQGELGIRRNDLAELVSLSVSGVTRALAPLEKLGYIERLDEAMDARVRKVGLTTTGAELYLDLLRDVEDRMDQTKQQLEELLVELTN